MISAKPLPSGTPSERWRAADANTSFPPHTIAGVNALPGAEKRAIYTGLIPEDLLSRFGLDRSLKDSAGRDLLYLNCPSGSSMAEMVVYHQRGFPDPLMYGQICDTLTGYVHILLYTLNNPASERFAIDCMPDGSPTALGAAARHLPAERAAMEYGLAPGQIRSGLRLLPSVITTFERFVSDLGHDMYFAEPLYYHNAVIFEHYGFAYEKGRRLMERIEQGFGPEGDLRRALDGSTPFRSQQAADSVRLRSWAIHDGLLGEPFTGVTMYKRVGAAAGMNTCPSCAW